MNTKRMMRWGIVLFLLAALPVMTAVMAQEQEPAGQLPVGTERGESAVAFPWTNTETEPNNSVNQANNWCPDNPYTDWYGDCAGVYGGIISSASDVDYWKVFVPGLDYYPWDFETFKTVTRDAFPMLFDIEAQSIGSPLNSEICLYSDDGYELACNDDTDTVDSMLYYNFEPSRNYYLAVRAHNGIGAGANGKYQLLVSTPYLISAAAKDLGTGTVEGIRFQSGDILAFSKYSGGYKWVMLFDLSDLGVKGNITNLSMGWRNSDYLLVGFAANTTLPGIGRPVTPWEVVQFDPTQIGPTTQGTFRLWWDGRGQGLTTSGEKLDAIDWPNWNGVTRLSVSTVGNAKVYGGPTANVLLLSDEDIGLWTYGPAAQNYPRWTRAVDTSTNNTAVADIVAFSDPEYNHQHWDDIYGSWTEDDAYAVLQGTPYSQKSVMILNHGCTVDEEGERCGSGVFSIPYWNGASYGWNYNIDAIQMQHTVYGQQ